MSILHRSALTVALALALPFASAQATTLDYLDNTGVGATGGWGATAQTFTAGAGQTLSSYAFVGGTDGANFTFSLYDWTTHSAALFSTTQAMVDGVNTLGGIDVALQAGHLYSAEVDYLGVTNGGVVFGSNVYAGGSAYWSSTGVAGNESAYSSFPMYDTAFQAVFTSSVPELGNPALLLTGLGVLGMIARRRRAR